MKHIIDTLAESVVLVEPSDLSKLADIHGHFVVLQSELAELNDGVAASAATAATALVEKIILKEIEDAESGLETIGETITALQEIIHGGRQSSDVRFPEGLELPTNADSPADQCALGSDNPTDDQALVADTAAPGSVDSDNDILAEFISQQVHVLGNMEELILTLEGPEEDRRLDELLRLIHTLKGESGFLGLQEIQDMCHHVESSLAAQDPTTLVDALLRFKDWLEQSFDALAGKSTPLAEPEATAFESELKDENPVSQRESTAPEVEEEQPNVRKEKREGSTDALSPSPVMQTSEDSVGEMESASDPSERVPLTGDPELLADFIQEAIEHLDTADTHLLKIETAPDDENAVNAVFRAFHTIKGVAGFLELSDIQRLAHQAENLLDAARKNEITLDGPRLDATFESVDMMKRLVEFVREALTAGSLLERDAEHAALIDRIVRLMKQDGPDGMSTTQSDSADELPSTNDDQLPENAAPKDASPATSAAIEAGTETGHPARQAGTSTASERTPCQTPMPEAPKPITGGESPSAQSPAGASKAIKVKETVKVDSTRLDTLVDSIGELVIAEAMVTQSPELHEVGSGRLSRLLGHLNKITRELQEMATSLRMVPVRSTFQRMARLARDTAKKTKKEVNFVMVGEDTELDKTVVDVIGDPLVHMVRNAIDHGIEPSVEDRVQRGKPPVGKVELRAFHKGGSIYIEIEDDGRGLDKQRILEKAKERDLLREGTVLSDNEIFNLVLEPGFSTAATVSDVSGRGVGMDVVKKNIQKMRGQIEIRSTQGEGTVFSIRLPLTLAIIDGMVVRVGSQRYALPLLPITRMLRPSEHDLPRVFEQGEMLTLPDGLIPLHRVHRLFDIEDAETDPAKTSVVVVEHEGYRVGLMVDELLGQQQIVIKTLGSTLKNVQGIAGGAIMPDGRVGLIIDIDGLIQIADSVETTSKCAA